MHDCLCRSVRSVRRLRHVYGNANHDSDQYANADEHADTHQHPDGDDYTDVNEHAYVY